MPHTSVAKNEQWSKNHKSITRVGNQVIIEYLDGSPKRILTASTDQEAMKLEQGVRYHNNMTREVDVKFTFKFETV